MVRNTSMAEQLIPSPILAYAVNLPRTRHRKRDVCVSHSEQKFDVDFRRTQIACKDCPLDPLRSGRLIELDVRYVLPEARFVRSLR